MRTQKAETWGHSTVRTACPLDCPDSCTLDITVEKGRIVSINGGDQNPVTKNYICGKVRRFGERVYGEDRLLYPAILSFCCIGLYTLNNNNFDVYMAVLFGVVGYIFDKADIPIAPLVLSLVLGGIMEQSFRQAMTISGGNPQIFVNSTITITLVVMSVISIITPFILARMKSFRNVNLAEAD